MTHTPLSADLTEFVSESGDVLHRHHGSELVISHINVGFPNDDKVYEVLGTTHRVRPDGSVTLVVTVCGHPPGHW